MKLLTQSACFELSDCGSVLMPGLVERLLYRVAKRWIAGYELEDAVKAAHDANARKLQVILNRLGEHTPDRGLIEEYTEEYLKLLDAINEQEVDGTISVKPSQLGLAVDPLLFRSNLERILERAEQTKRFVWLDMENSPYTEATLRVYTELLSYRTHIAGRPRGPHGESPRDWVVDKDFVCRPEMCPLCTERRTCRTF